MSEIEAEVEVSDPVRLVAAPLVSVLMITYNHAEYLEQAVASVVSQQCDFPIELIIGEDASADATREVALRCQRLHPDVIRVVYSSRNVGGVRNYHRIVARARGQFLAFCEGDDYWCALDKLARQVALIRDDPDVSIVHGDWIRLCYARDAWREDARGSAHRRVPLRYLQGDLFETWYFPKVLRTCTTLIRRSLLEDLLTSGLIRREYRFGDSVQNLFAASRGRVAYIPDVIAAYRISPNSMLRSGAASRVGFYRSAQEFDDDARAYFASIGKPYGMGYRWETDIALLLWSLRARQPRAAWMAMRDIASHFGLVGFMATGWKSIRMRWPSSGRRSQLPRERGPA